MQSRRLTTPEEFMEARKVSSIAFLYSLPDQIPAPTPETFARQTDFGAYDDTGRMISSLTNIHYRIRYEGQWAPMGGIAGVVSLPEARRRGGVRTLFYDVLAEMRERGEVFSYLFPFSNSYYRQFGYEVGIARHRMSIPSHVLSTLPQEGSVSMFRPGDDPSQIKEIYRVFADGINMMMDRSQREWDALLKHDPNKEQRYTYVWSDDSGQARAYIQIYLRQDGNKQSFAVQELVYTDVPAMRRMLGFLRTFSSQVSHVVWDAPSFISPRQLFMQPEDISVTLYYSGMNRIVLPLHALKMLYAPEGTGSTVIEVSDGFLKENIRVRAAWQHGELEAELTGAQPDLECSIQALSQLAPGIVSLDEALTREDVALHSNGAQLSKLFPKRRTGLLNNF